MSSDSYCYNVPGKAESRFYMICESEDGDGWVVCWHTQSGNKHHPVKRLGRYDGVEEAQVALDKLAAQMDMRYWQEFSEPTRFGVRGEWRRVRAEISAND